MTRMFKYAGCLWDLNCNYNLLRFWRVLLQLRWETRFRLWASSCSSYLREVCLAWRWVTVLTAYILSSTAQLSLTHSPLHSSQSFHMASLCFGQGRSLPFKLRCRSRPGSLVLKLVDWAAFCFHRSHKPFVWPMFLNFIVQPLTSWVAVTVTTIYPSIDDDQFRSKAIREIP